jgi:hypothetical protein
VLGPLVVTIVATAAVNGTPEPCGCNSDPLGDVARVATLAKEALWVDAGSLLFDPELSQKARAQAEATAGELARIFARAEVGLGEADLKYGPAEVKPPRQACNVRGVPAVPPHVRVVGGVKIGVFGVTAPELLRAHKLEASDPGPAAKQTVAALQKQGAQVIVMLAGGMTRRETRALLKNTPGVTFAIVGAEVDDGMQEPEKIGDAWLMAPGEQLKQVVKLSLSLGEPGKPVALFAGAAARKLERERADKRIATLAAQLATWQKDASADRAFVAARQAELEGLRVERARMNGATADTPPATGNWFTYELVPVRHVIPRDEAVATELRALAKKIGGQNFKMAATEPAPAAEPGQPRFTGVRACVKCHKPAVEFWKHTVHAEAWRSLVAVDKQYHYGCIGCHVTGWDKAGGSNLGTVEKRGLVDVQCEVCHGPGSKHVEEAGLEEPKSLVRRPPDSFCADTCHTHEHSDTFTLVPYLRDILGTGHGEEARVKLGDGPTGHEIRQKALQQAGRMH